MLVIEPTADGRLRISNSHRSDYARNETSARALAYSWGHTDISINKALTELRAAARGEARPGGWRATRRAQEKAPPAAEPESPAAQQRRQRVKKAAAAPTPGPTAPVAAAPAAKTARAPRKRARAVEAAASPAKKAAAPPRSPAKNDAPRERALALLREGVKELSTIEAATLAFARGPWTDLREMAEHIATCLEGKRPRTAWTREEK